MHISVLSVSTTYFWGTFRVLHIENSTLLFRLLISKKAIIGFNTSHRKKNSQKQGLNLRTKTLTHSRKCFPRFPPLFCHVGQSFSWKQQPQHGCQMAIASFWDCRFLALGAWRTFAMLRCKIWHLATLSRSTTLSLLSSLPKARHRQKSSWWVGGGKTFIKASIPEWRRGGRRPRTFMNRPSHGP